MALSRLATPAFVTVALLGCAPVALAQQASTTAAHSTSPTWLDLTLAGGLLLASLIAGFAVGSRLAAAVDRWLLPLQRWARRHGR